MERRSFLRNIALACAAVAVPLKWVPPVVEEVSCKGIFWHIQHGGTVVDYMPGSLKLSDLHQLINILQNAQRNGY